MGLPAESAAKHKILVVDDEPSIVDAVAGIASSPARVCMCTAEREPTMARESLEKEGWHAARSQSVLRDVNEHIAQTPGEGRSSSSSASAAAARARSALRSRSKSMS